MAASQAMRLAQLGRLTGRDVKKKLVGASWLDLYSADRLLAHSNKHNLPGNRIYCATTTLPSTAPAPLPPTPPLTPTVIVYSPGTTRCSPFSLTSARAGPSESTHSLTERLSPRCTAASRWKSQSLGLRGESGSSLAA
jgi:hypothetical protein